MRRVFVPVGVGPPMSEPAAVQRDSLFVTDAIHVFFRLLGIFGKTCVREIVSFVKQAFIKIIYKYIDR